MALFKLKTKNYVFMNSKPRVYFTCHPEDFEKHFQKICDDVFKNHDCAIYYTEDMTEVIAEDDEQVALGRHNAFIVPVTLKLLTTPNRAMDKDVPYALKEHIPILPIMMEPGIDELYSQPNKFGELQYLNPYSTDTTEISYEEKLKKYLESVLISNTLAKRVQSAFNAYVFLSYRKKDRKYANELIRLIHSNPESRNIAIWFDEFLTPGESFKENIEEKLNDCKLFVLLVTPRLLEKVIDENNEERDNYVISTELPLALKNKEENGTEILAVEMEDTDKALLSVIDAENCIKLGDNDFHDRLRATVSRIPVITNNTPEHDFLIGLAYLEGIYVEIDRAFAIKKITEAALNENEDAILKLIDIYGKGIGVEVSKEQEILWTQNLIKYRQKRFDASGDFSSLMKLQSALSSFVELLCLSGEITKSVDVAKKSLEEFTSVVERALKKHTFDSPTEEALYKEACYAHIIDIYNYTARSLVIEKQYDEAKKLLLKVDELLFTMGDSNEPFVKTIETANNFKLSKACGVLMQTAENYATLGTLELSQRHYESALSYYTKQYNTITECLDRYPDEKEGVHLLCDALYNIGSVKHSLDEDEEAIVWLENANHILHEFFGHTESHRELTLIASCHQMKARIHLSNNKMKEACKELCESIRINKQIVVDQKLTLYLRNYNNDVKIAQMIIQKMQTNLIPQLHTPDQLMELWSLADNQDLKNAIKSLLHSYYEWCKNQSEESIAVDNIEKSQKHLFMCVKIQVFFAKHYPSTANLKRLSKEYEDVAEFMKQIHNEKEAIDNYKKALEILIQINSADCKRIKRKLFRLYFWNGDFTSAFRSLKKQTK